MVTISEDDIAFHTTVAHGEEKTDKLTNAECAFIVDC